MFKTGFSNIFKGLIDLVFPPRCSLCGTIDDSSRYPSLCSACFESFTSIGEPLCTICGTPYFSQSTGSHPCPLCIKEKPRYDGARSSGSYGGNLGEAVKKLKYGRERALARPIADFLLRVLEPFITDLKPDIIVPVPLHIKKLRERGFNQSLLIAAIISEKIHAPVDCSSLIKNRVTAPQVELKFEERRENIRKSFSVEPGGVFEGKRLLLVDDVITTGSTLSECARVLKKEGGAKEVFCAAAAKSLGRP